MVYSRFVDTFAISCNGLVVTCDAMSWHQLVVWDGRQINGDRKKKYSKGGPPTLRQTLPEYNFLLMSAICCQPNWPLSKYNLHSTYFRSKALLGSLSKQTAFASEHQTLCRRQLGQKAQSWQRGPSAMICFISNLCHICVSVFPVVG